MPVTKRIAECASGCRPDYTEDAFSGLGAEGTLGGAVSGFYVFPIAIGASVTGRNTALLDGLKVLLGDDIIGVGEADASYNGKNQDGDSLHVHFGGSAVGLMLSMLKGLSRLLSIYRPPSVSPEKKA